MATSLGNLAVLYQEQGRYDEAEALHKRALAIREKALGAGARARGHHASRTWPSSTGLQGRFDEAEPLYLRALEILEKSLGAEHPEVAVSLNNLAELYRAQGRFDEAAPLYERALAVAEAALGPDHPDVALILTGMARSLRADRPAPLRPRR